MWELVILEDNSENNNNRDMINGCYICMILSIVSGLIILAMVAFAIICFGLLYDVDFAQQFYIREYVVLSIMRLMIFFLASFY